MPQFLDQARGGNFDYLIVPAFVFWEDNATEWSGKSDRIEIEVRSIEVKSGETIALGSISGKSKWATFGGDRPEDLLAKPLDAYVTWLCLPLGTPPPPLFK